MATIVLQVVGAAIGGAIGGPVGATIGRAVGAAAGYAIDQKIFTKDQVITGPRLEGSRFLSSNDGASIPKVYGRTQLGGQIIWATRFEEVRSTRKQGGGKGGPSTHITEFTYFGNFAIGICAGEVSRIGRIWADGSELDLSKLKFRVYLGSQEQQPDPMIEALQSPGNTPAYRGLAYVVFEDFPLAKFGNRIPQLTFEVARSVGKLEPKIKSVCIIPGSTAFGYSPQKLRANIGSGITRTQNRHNLVAGSDWAASIDELQALCPNLENVSLIVAWFGNDIRAGNCQIKPGVERRSIHATGHPWIVSGTNPAQAHLISDIDGRPAFGSTPTDKSVIKAIQDLHARGLKVTLYPFIMMDIPADNILPNPTGGPSQPAYPWRGEITCYPAIGETSSVDKTATARTQIENFSGNTNAANFNTGTNTITYSGPAAGQWNYRRMILHYAHLAQLAGGVDNFLIGSEMRGLNSVRDKINAFPFVDELVSLAADVTTILAPFTKLTYGADWSEYFGYHPQDGSNDLYFNLDPLWSSPAIDAIGIDNYMPLADWRDSGDPQDRQATEYDPQYLASNIAGGEGYDWYYASQQARIEADRTPITDGGGEPWVWRYKDLKSWWQNTHHERVSGFRSATPTAWVPQSKPFWFTELGCPAIDKGANQPNVFSDRKSSQSAAPYFSNSNRDDLIQRKFIQAHLEYWGEGASQDDKNPPSNLYNGRMVDLSQISIWTWDARPFPAFPVLSDIWSDGENWETGHWLNARLGNCSLDDLVAQILEDFSFAQYDVSDLRGWVDGFAVPHQASARQVLEPLLNLFGASATSLNGKISFLHAASNFDADLQLQNLVEQEGLPTLTIHRLEETDLPKEVIIHHDELRLNIESVASKSRRLESKSERQIQMQLPVVIPSNFARHLADMRVRELWISRDSLQINLPLQSIQYVPGDTLKITDNRYRGLWQITSIEEGHHRQLDLRRVELPASLSFPASLPALRSQLDFDFGKPLTFLLDIPRPLTSIAHTPKLLAATSAKPWAADYAYASSPQNTGFEIRQTSNKRGTIGKLIAPLNSGPQSRWDYTNQIRVEPINGSFDAKAPLLVLNGANSLALQSDGGEWELIQYADAVLESDGSWTLSKLLRAQLGTEKQMEQGSSAGSYLVLLDQQIASIDLADLEKNISLNWRVGPTTDPLSSDSYDAQTLTFTDNASKPFSPVHIKAKRLANDDLEISWIRRSRIYGDDWQAVEIPLGDVSENYTLSIFDGQANVREIQAQSQKAIYSQADQLADFSTLPNSLSLTIAQLDAFNNPGSARSATLNT